LSIGYDTKQSLVTMPKFGTEPFRRGVEESMSGTGGGSSLFSSRLQRIMVYGLVIFAVVPLALGLLLFTPGSGATAPFLTTYYVIAILGLAGIMFERLVNEIPKTPNPAR